MSHTETFVPFARLLRTLFSVPAHERTLRELAVTLPVHLAVLLSEVVDAVVLVVDELLLDEAPDPFVTAITVCELGFTSTSPTVRYVS